MTAPQGKVRYPGIDAILGCSYSLGWGIEPGVITVQIPPSNNLVQRYGDFHFLYDNVTITVKNCAVSSIDEQNNGGLRSYSVTILDGRWRWREGQITGEYNLKDPDDVLYPDTERTTRELAELLLDAMQVTVRDLTDLPATEKPYVLWDVANPAQELQALVERVGCVIVYNVDGSVDIRKRGTGAAIPVTHPWFLNGKESFSQKPLPPELYFAAQPTIWQVDLALYPIGLDTDNEFKPIDDLSYRPATGWYTFAAEEYIEDNPSVYTNSVFRYWKIKEDQIPDLPRFGFDEQGNPVGSLSIEKLEQILPLINEQVDVDTITKPDGTKGTRARDAWLWGEHDDYFRIAEDENGNALSVNDPEVNARLRYAGSVQIMEDQGIVVTQDPLKYCKQDGSLVEATLKLRCCVNGRDKDTRSPWRFLAKVPVDPLSGSPPRWITREDVRHQYSGTGDNQAEVSAQATFYLQQELSNYQLNPSGTANFAGFLPIRLDGALQQISYSIDGSGHARCSMSRNTEELTNDMSYEERLLISKTKQTIAEKRWNKRQTIRTRKIAARWGV